MDTLLFYLQKFAKMTSTPVKKYGRPLEDYEKYINNEVPSKPIPEILQQFLTNAKTSKLNDNCPTKFHVAVLMKRGKIVKIAWNKMGSRSSGASTNGSQCFVHAEKNLILSVKKNYELLRGADIYVMRISNIIDNKRSFQYSQPCPECTCLLNKCLKQHKLKTVYFTS